MNVEVVYATPDAQTIVEIELAEHATVSDALNASGLYKQYPSIEAGVTPVGIYGERVHYNTGSGTATELRFTDHWKSTLCRRVVCAPSLRIHPAKPKRPKCKSVSWCF